MAKRNVGKAQGQFNQLVASIPSKAWFELTMPADTTDEIWDDIDTNLDDGEAWVIYGGSYSFQGSAATSPIKTMEATVANAWELQVHRNVRNELLLDWDNDDVMFHHHYENAFAGAAFYDHVIQPFFFGEKTVTFSEQLRVIWRTYADCAVLAAGSILRGCLYYDRISAPSIGQSKLGQLANL